MGEQGVAVDPSTLNRWVLKGNRTDGEREIVAAAI